MADPTIGPVGPDEPAGPGSLKAAVRRDSQVLRFSRPPTSAMRSSAG